MRRASSLRDLVTEAAEWLKDRAELLACDDLWATNDNELRYVHELKNSFRNAPKSGFLMWTRNRMIALAISSSPVSFECVEPLGSKSREILGRAAFGVAWKEKCQTGMLNWSMLSYTPCALDCRWHLEFQEVVCMWIMRIHRSQSGITETCWRKVAESLARSEYRSP